MSAIDRARARSKSMTMVPSSYKAAGGGLIDMTGGMASNLGLQDEAKNRRRYGLFRGWVHSAIHALAEGASGQEVNIERKPKEESDQKPKIGKKTAKDEVEIITDSPISKLLEKPNTIQYREQFVYSFVANMMLTGRGYIVADKESKDKTNIWSLPSTWIRPIHKKGPYSEFKIVNPFTGQSDGPPLTQENVAFAILPDPSNPLGAMPPAAAQERAIKIDDNIQSTQLSFFDNGIFPSVILTVGKTPHPDVPAGVRPRLTAAQRRQVYGAIRKVSGGVANYGNPAIIDGLIEKIDRLSPTQNEIGWQNSEKPIRNRILSAYGVHPFILGEEMVGSYAQAYIVLSRFAEKVNNILRVLDTICTDFFPQLFDIEDQNVRWVKKEAEDPSLKQKIWMDARKNDDVSQNELRAFMGLPPDEDANQSYIGKGIAGQVVTLAEKVKSGSIEAKQAEAILIGLGLPDKIAKDITKAKVEKPQAPGGPGAFGGAPGSVPPGAPPSPQQGGQQSEPGEDEDADADAIVN